MQAIERAWTDFFRQFAPHVFAEGELIEDPDNTLYPRITYSYQTADYFVNTLTTFQVWDWSHSDNTLLGICNKIAEAVPIGMGAVLAIPGEIRHEYFDPASGLWTEFDLAEFQTLADSLAPDDIVWREVESGSAGGIEIWRGSPFLTLSPKDEAMSRVRYGTLQARYLNTI